MVGADVPGGPRPPKAFPKASPCARRAGDVAPYQGRGQDVGMVGADVPAARVPNGVIAGVPVCAARRGRRALPGARAGHGAW